MTAAADHVLAGMVALRVAGDETECPVWLVGVCER